MPTAKSRQKKQPKRVLALPDLEHAKTSAGVRCVVFGTCGRRTIVLIALVGREGHGLAGPQQVSQILDSSIRRS
jgi:hypothetical protein